MIAVLDTNVIVSAFLIDKGNPARILDAALLRRFVMVASETIFSEYREVLARPRFDIPAVAHDEILAYLDQIALKVEPESFPLGLPDPDDEIFLAAAIASQADHLVTGNLKHFPPVHRRGVSVISPAEFVKQLPQ